MHSRSSFLAVLAAMVRYVMFGYSLTLVATSAFSQETKDAAMKARGMMATGDHAGARTFLENELNKRPNSGNLLHAYADVLTALGDETLAQAARLKACVYRNSDACRLIKPDPLPSATMETPSSTASRCLADGVDAFFDRPMVAKNRFLCAIEASPNSGYAHGALGLALAKTGSPSEAAAAFETACALGHAPSCQRRAILAAFAGKKTADEASTLPKNEITHTVFLKDDRTISGKLIKENDKVLLLATPQGTKEIATADVREVFALISERDLANRGSPWQQWGVEIGVGLGYSFSSSRFDPDGTKGQGAFQYSLVEDSRNLHTLSGKLSAGIFLLDPLEIELFSRILAALTDDANEVFLQAGISALYHIPIQSTRLFFGPAIGTEATVDEISPDGDNPLTTAAGLMAAGVFGIKVPVGNAAAIEAGLTLAYSYAAGTRADGASESEHRFRGLLEVGILWYP